MKGADSGIEIVCEFAGIVTVDFPLNHSGNLADLHGRQGHSHAVERVNRIARISDNVPAIG